MLCAICARWVEAAEEFEAKMSRRGTPVNLRDELANRFSKKFLEAGYPSAWGMAHSLAVLPQRLQRYAFTYFILSVDFIRRSSHGLLFAVAAAVASGLMLPIPIALLVAIVFAVKDGRSEVGFKATGTELNLPVSSAFYAAIGLALFVYLLRFAVSYIIIQFTIRWQNELFWRSINLAPRLARLDAVSQPIFGGLSKLATMISSSVVSGIMIGRLLASGPRSIAVVTAMSVFVLWVDPGTSFVLLLLSLVFVPVYAQVFLRMIQTRKRMRRQVLSMWPLLRQVHDSVVSNELEVIQWSQMSTADVGAFSSAYTAMNWMTYWLSLVQLAAAFHFFVGFAAIFYLFAPHQSGLSEVEALYLTALFLLLKEFSTLVNLMGGLTRNYQALSRLRYYFYSLRKKNFAPENVAEETRYILSVGSGETHELAFGDRIVLYGESINFSHDLVPLTNAIQPVKGRVEGRRNFVTLFTSVTLSALLDDSSRKSVSKDVRVVAGGESINLVVGQCAPVPPPAIVALTGTAWAEARANMRLAVVLGTVVTVVVNPSGGEEDGLEHARRFYMQGDEISSTPFEESASKRGRAKQEAAFNPEDDEEIL